MSAPGPAAAAAAYLGRLPAAALAAAPVETARGEIVIAGSIAVLILGAWTVARAGVLGRIEAGLAVAGRPRWMADAACAAAAAGLTALALLPLALVAAWETGRLAALAPALVGSLRQAAVCSLAGAVLAPALYALMRRLPRLWAPLLGGLAAALVFAAVWLPFAQASGPASLPAAPAGAARTGLLQLIAATHVPASEVYLSPNPAIDADVTGAGPARVVVSDGLWTRASPQELRASIGHLIGHYVHRDQLSVAVLLAVLTLGLFLALQALAAPAARLMGARGIMSTSDATAAPALIAVAIVYLSLGAIADHALIRWINVRADQYSLDHAREPDGLAMALLHEWKGEAVDPSPLQEALFYSHPPLRSRLLHAMRWKAAHPAG